MPDAVPPLVPSRRQSGPFAGNDEEAPNSIFGEILDWMLAPLLFVWPISIAATNHVASHIADQPYDQNMTDHVVAIVRLVDVEGARVRVNLPSTARALLRSDETDTQYFQVTGTNGSVISGDKEIPWATLPTSIVRGEVHFRDDTIGGEPVRVAYSFIPVRPGLVPVLVQVAETRHRREEMASRIISGVLLPQFAIIPLAVILVYFGLSKGLAPLHRLQARLLRRRPGDLSPMPAERAPDELRPLLLALNEMMGRLEENLQAQQRFIAQAAHQMRTPLTGLKMQTELALTESDPAAMHESLHLIAESTDRATHLINQLLVLARTEASHEKVHRVELVDLEALARAGTQEWVPRALAKHIDIGFEGTYWTLMIEGVPLLLRELISNLIDNAIKYTPDGGRVTVRVRATEFAVLEVEDNGIGIPHEERAHVFERFYRVLGTEEEGSGLGLPIVAEIAELHRARIELLDPDNGQGCLFRVSFARRGGPAAPLDLRPD